MSRRVLIALALCLFGCASKDSTKVVSAANEWAFWKARYVDQCVSVPAVPTYCSKAHEGLAVSAAAIEEANEALKRGGKLRLQIRRMRRVLGDLGKTGVKP